MYLSDLIKVALRYNAVYLPFGTDAATGNAGAAAFAAQLARCGYMLDEKAMRAAARASDELLEANAAAVADIFGLHNNWAPLVKAWKTPVDCNEADIVATLFANMFPDESIRGTRLPCGHLIPEGTFPLERYNGCPFCGTPFELSSEINPPTRPPRKTLTLYTEADLRNRLADILASPMPPDPTTADTLSRLVRAFGLTDDAARTIAVQETACVAAKALLDAGEDERATVLWKNPSALLRFICYLSTGSPRKIRPKTMLANMRRAHVEHPGNAENLKPALRFHFSRRLCAAFARRLDSMELSVQQMCEDMHTDREMWVRVIRALRLPEYCRRKKLTNLTSVLDAFYNKRYDVWLGAVEKSYIGGDAEKALALLSGRPGMFARALFSCMLRFGADRPLASFAQVASSLPARLLLSLADNAAIYFLPAGATRLIVLPSAATVNAPVNPLLAAYSAAERASMAEKARTTCLTALARQFALDSEATETTVYMAPEIAVLPVPVGLRSNASADIDPTLPGTAFEVEGDNVRLFMQWGKGLPAQHLDMDLSAAMFRADGSAYQCAYYSPTVPGAQHSGDIIHIPDYTGTAEYIELDIAALKQNEVTYVAFTCNAYSDGNITPGLVVGWMDSALPMTVSDTTGVAYNPADVVRQIRVTETNLAKGLVFAVLDVVARSVIWLELPFNGRRADNLRFNDLMSMLRRIKTKTTFGQLLDARVGALGLKYARTADEADKAYLTARQALSLLG